MIRRPPRSTRTYTLFPSTTLFRSSFGSCRLCLVEVEGRNGYPASCTTPVAEGMVVRTQTERLKQLRRGVMALYIFDHPLDCLTCAANRSEEHTSELQSLMRISYAVFCLKNTSTHNMEKQD